MYEKEQQARTVASIGESTERHSIWAAFLPFIILIVVVVLWTGPWSPLPKVSWFSTRLLAISSISHKSTNVAFSFTPFVGGTAILASWLIMLAFIRPSLSVLGTVFRDTFRQMWGALLVGVFIFGLAYTSCFLA